MDYTLKILENKIELLERNGNPLSCPFKNDIVIMQQSKLTNKVEQIVSPAYCSSNCVLFNRKGSTINLMCSDTVVVVDAIK